MEVAMHAQTLKQEALESIQRLPDNADIDDRLHVLDKLRKSRAAIEQGQVISHDDLKHEINQW